MKDPNDFGLQDVYLYKTSDDLRNYYNDWAHSYDDFVEQTGYILPDKLADFIAENVNEEDKFTILDIGSGTGVLGESIKKVLPHLTIDGVDISFEMSQLADKKTTASGSKCYRYTYVSDATKEVFASKESYDLLVSTGTFTPGHLDCSHLLSMVQYLKKNGAVFISVNKQHYIDQRFADTLSEAVGSGMISEVAFREVEAWNNEKYSMKAMLIFFVKLLETKCV
jgi:predicted TPR repeat methyltransferase